MKLYFVEYMQAGSGFPVDCTVGLRSKSEAIKHGRRVAADKGYCGFWIAAKPPKAGMDPIREEYHPVWFAPSGKATFSRPVVIPQKTKQG